MADHSVWVGQPTSSARVWRSTWHGVGLASTTAMRHGKYNVIGVHDFSIASVTSRRRRRPSRASAAHVDC